MCVAWLWPCPGGVGDAWGCRCLEPASGRRAACAPGPQPSPGRCMLAPVCLVSSRPPCDRGREGRLWRCRCSSSRGGRSRGLAGAEDGPRASAAAAATCPLRPVPRVSGARHGAGTRSAANAFRTPAGVHPAGPHNHHARWVLASPHFTDEETEAQRGEGTPPGHTIVRVRIWSQRVPSPAPGCLRPPLSGGAPCHWAALTRKLFLVLLRTFLPSVPPRGRETDAKAPRHCHPR